MHFPANQPKAKQHLASRFKWKIYTFVDSQKRLLIHLDSCRSSKTTLAVSGTLHKRVLGKLFEEFLLG